MILVFPFSLTHKGNLSIVFPIKSNVLSDESERREDLADIFKASLRNG